VRVERAVLGSALKSFLAGLDADVLAALQADGSALIETYNHYWEGDGTVQRNRIQAACSFPSFSNVLREDGHLRRSVDQGAPLLPQLAARYQLKPRTIRQVRASIPADVAPEQRIELLKRIDRLPAEYAPKTIEDWRVFQDTCRPLADLSEAIGTDFAALARPYANGWQAGAHALSAKLGEALAFDAIFDFMQATYRYGVRPSLQQALAAKDRQLQVAAAPPPAFFPLWFGRYGVARLFAMALRWQDAYQPFSIERLGKLARKSHQGVEQGPLGLA
jgi:hypothetical protein